MKNFINSLLIYLGLSMGVQAQIISQFTWESNPVTNADVGPNATSVSSSATSSTGGSGGTNGLNAGTPKMNLNLVIPTGSGVFDVDGLEFSMDYQRDESVGNMLNRGSSLIIQGGNKFTVSYRVKDGAGGFTTVSSGSAYTCPNDNTWRTYVFKYTPSTGIGELLVNGVSQWTNDGPDNRGLYWSGAGDITIGSGMDGSGSNRAFFDNLIISEVEGGTGTLPIELGAFEVEKISNDKVEVNWTTISEINNDYFTIERTKDGNIWESIETINGAGNSFQTLRYTYVDEQPLSGTSYYRLKQTDFDGQFSYSDPVAIKIEANSKQVVFPNPATNLISIKNDNNDILEYTILNASGKTLLTKRKVGTLTHIDISELKPGVYHLRSETSSSWFIKN